MTTADTRQQRRFRNRQERKGIAKPQKNAYRRAYEAFKMRAEALKAASIMTPILAKLALMDLAGKLGAYKSRGHGRGTPSRRYGLSSSHTPHQGGQEGARRMLGGWAFNKLVCGLTKKQTIAMCQTPSGRSKFALLRRPRHQLALAA